MKYKVKDANVKKPDSGKPHLSYDRLFSLFEISKEITRIDDSKRLLHDILQAAITHIEAERGMIILVDQTGNHYQSVASESFAKDKETFSSSIVARTLEQKKTLMSTDLKSDAMFKDAESVKSLNILSFICIPLMISGIDNPVGTLYVDQRIYVKNFTEEDKIFLESFANLAATAINNVSHLEQLLNENLQLRMEVGKKYEFPEIVGKSKTMQKIMQDIKRIMNDNSTVLLVGESGSGKEVVAKTIHYSGNRRNKPFLAINCGALPETLLEAELFGSVRGAFTGALDKKGLFQAAEGGTIFLDEIHHTSPAMQIKLMRVLQEREIRRVGGTSMNKINVRLICATNEDLEKDIQEGNLRKDFYYRINIVRIDLPPLREHREDIPILAHYFLEKFCREKNKRIAGFHPAAMELLTKYSWAENNIRELENEIERTVIFAEHGANIRPSDLSGKLCGDLKSSDQKTRLFIDDKEAPLSHAQFEVEYIRFVLAKAGGNKSQAAKIMGIPRTTLIGKMRKYSID